MPARVVVVKRARRRPFALLWAAIAWLRSALAALFGRSRAPASSSESAVWLPGPPRIPALRFSGAGDALCTACNLCVEICPSRALSLDSEAPAGHGRPRRFVLQLGACIGCRACAEACPEAALDLIPAPNVAIAGGSGRPVPIDLLAGTGLRQ